MVKIKKLFLIFVPKKLHKNMIAIVDGGATKCDWVLLHENGEEELLKTQTIGLNPNIIAHDKIASEIEKNPDLIKIKNDLKNIYFYGAGCGFDENKEIVKAAAIYGVQVPSVIEYKNISAFQFHPEKSGENGLRILKNFCFDGAAKC